MSNKSLDIKVVTLIDAFVILSPLLLLFFILLFEGQPRSILDKPEWSFITVFYLVEILRDQVVRLPKGGYHIKQVESGVVFYAILLVIGVLVLSLDFKYSIGEANLSSNEVYVAKFGVFGLALVIFFVHRLSKYKLNRKEFHEPNSENVN